MRTCFLEHDWGLRPRIGVLCSAARRTPTVSRSPGQRPTLSRAGTDPTWTSTRKPRLPREVSPARLHFGGGSEGRGLYRAASSQENPEGSTWQTAAGSTLRERQGSQAGLPHLPPVAPRQPGLAQGVNQTQLYGSPSTYNLLSGGFFLRENKHSGKI